MPTPVTVLGAGQGTTPQTYGTITLPYTSAALASQVQAALFTVSGLVTTGAFTQYNVVPGPQVPSAPIIGGVVDTVSGSANLGIMAPNLFSLVDASPSVLAVIGSAATTIVATGPNSQLIYQNQATNANIFIGGGNNYLKEAFNISNANISIDASSSVLGSGAAIIDGSVVGSSTTVNSFANTLVALIPGGSIVVNAGVGTIAAQVNGGSTVAVTINGNSGAGSTIEYLPNGGNTFILPGNENVIVINNPSAGSATLFGGNVAGLPVAPNFTGTATVNGGTGYFQGGTGGTGTSSNQMSTSTIAGATTLIGGGSGDVLTANGQGVVLRAGVGNESLVGSVAAGGGAQFFLGTGAGVGTGVVFGDQGFDTISTGTGSATINLGHGTSFASGNVVKELGVGGSTTIGGFLSAPFPNKDVFVLLNGVTSSITSASGPSGFTSVARLSDGTTVTFSNTFQAVTNVNGTIS